MFLFIDVPGVDRADYEAQKTEDGTDDKTGLNDAFSVGPTVHPEDRPAPEAF